MKKSLFTLLCISTFIFNVFAQNTTILPLVADDEATLFGISNNGKWAVGYAFDNSDNAGFNIAASVWNLETGERKFLATAEEGMSEANCVNNEGTIIGGAYLNQPAYYQDGKWNTLQMPDGYTMGTVMDMAIVGGDVIFVGRVQDNDAAQSIIAAKWVNGVYEQVTDRDLRRDHMGEAANVNTCYAISEDGSVIMGALEYNAWPNVTPFVINGEEKFIIETENEQNKNLSYIFEPKMSANGKYITGKYRHIVYNEGENFASTDIYQPCLYNIETKQFEIFEKVGVEWGGWDVDNNGVVYANTPVNEHPIRQGYIITNGNAVELETVLLEKGISQADIDAASAPASEEFDNKLGTIMAVSRDGKTIIGCAGKCSKYNWVIKLDDAVGVNNISYDNLAAFYNNETIILFGMVDAIEVYNINGAMIINQPVESAFIPAQLEKGIYIIKMYNHKTNTICSSKIIVK